MQFGRRPLNEYGYRSTGAAKHTHVRPKSRVEVVLHDGTTFVDIYLRCEGKKHYFKDRGQMKSNLIAQVKLYSKSRQIQKNLERETYEKRQRDKRSDGDFSTPEK